MVDLCPFHNTEGLKLLGRLASVHVYGTANQQSSLSCDILKEFFKKPNFSTGGNTNETPVVSTVKETGVSIPC